MHSKESRSYIAHTRLEAILETAVDAIISINSVGIIDTFNPAAEKLFGYSTDEVIGKNINILMPEPYSSKHDSYLKRYSTTKVKKIIGIGRDIVAKHRDGKTFPARLSVGEAVIDGKPIYIGIIHDISVRKQQEKEIKDHRDHLQSLVEQRTRQLSEANEELTRIAHVDGLTKLSNRRTFDETLQNEMQRSIRYKLPITLMMCDIDYFKQYNDAYGHVVGDECLIKIAGCLKDSFKRASDLATRYGGEEFAIILPHTNDKEAEQLSKTCIENIRKLKVPHSDSGVSKYVTISIGVATIIPDKTDDADLLIKAADEELYKAKKNGRNRIETVCLG